MSLVLCLPHRPALPANEPAGGQEHLLVTPVMKNETYLVRLPGEVRHVWHSKLPPSGPGRMDAEGALLRVERDHLPKAFQAGGGSGGRITRISRDGTELWSHSLASNTCLAHHDALLLPNGNVLALVWERHEAAEAAAKGRDAQKMGKAGVWSECVWEIQPEKQGGGRVVWRWNAWDHLGSQAPQDGWIDANGGWAVPAWAGVTRLEYSAQRDQILLMARGYGAVWIIDHSTTTQEAASAAGGSSGRGGRLLQAWAGEGSHPPADEQGRILDAEWAAAADGRDMAVRVLRRTGKKSSAPGAYAIEEWQLPVDEKSSGVTGASASSAGRLQPQLLSSMALPATGEGWQAQPTAFSGTLVTFGTAGIVRQIVRAEAGWSEFHNREGETTLRVTRPAPDAQSCCGGEPAPPLPAVPAQKQTKRQSPSQSQAEMQAVNAASTAPKTAPVLRSRAVPALPWMTALPSTPPGHSVATPPTPPFPPPRRQP